jgi:hypothetical protein
MDNFTRVSEQRRIQLLVVWLDHDSVLKTPNAALPSSKLVVAGEFAGSALSS